MTGVYIHVPFCIRKCPYCAFYSVAASDSRIEGYMSALKRSLLEYNGSIKVDTVYFGGGTPSLLGYKRIVEILDSVGKSFELCDPEITLECNPCTVDMDVLRMLYKAGVNRLSVGVQSLNDGELRFLGRLHDSERAKKTISYAKAVGFENISADLMIGIKGQTAEELSESVSVLSELGVTHISAYMINTEKGTPFDSADIRSKLMDDDSCAQLYFSLVEICEKYGYAQYEVSNYAIPGFESRHNLKYWELEDYIGFGPSAHSYFNGVRYYVSPSVDDFVSEVKIRTVIEDASPDRAEEYVMLGLRLRKGISLNKAVSLGMSENQARRARAFAENCCRSGLCALEGDRIALTPKGMLVSNTIIAEFLSQ